MDDLLAPIEEALDGGEAWIVGGALRDELLGRPVVDVDVACRRPREVAIAFASTERGAPFPLSERHGAWRVVVEEGRTVDFTPLPDGIEADLGSRDFTINAMARRVGADEIVDPFGGLRDLDVRSIRAVSPGVFTADPLRLLRAVRLEDELGFRCEPETEQLVRENAGLADRPAGERILAELLRLSVDGYRRLDELGLLAPLGGSVELVHRAGLVDSAEFRLVCFLGMRIERLPASRRLARYAQTLLRAEAPPDASPRAIHRFRRSTEPWAIDAVAYVGAPELTSEIVAARANDPAEPLLRGDELGLPPGPEIGRLLDLVAEERAAGVVSTREEALDLVRRHTR
jgi:hypothetical protein